MIKMVIWDQSKPISLILKIKNSKIQKSEICAFHVIIHENGNKTRIKLIRKTKSTSFIFNNPFCEMKGKNVINWGGGLGE